MLVTVDRPINKDTEMHPLVRWQYLGGIPESGRRAFLFNKPTDLNGNSYDIPVVVGAMAASREIYRIGMRCALDEIGTNWVRAVDNPVERRLVSQAPSREFVIAGVDLDVPGHGLDALPVPISKPGFDNAPYTTAGHTVTRDPDTGIQNAGIYRCQIKAPRRLGVNPALLSLAEDENP